MVTTERFVYQMNKILTRKTQKSYESRLPLIRKICKSLSYQFDPFVGTNQLSYLVQHFVILGSVLFLYPPNVNKAKKEDNQ